MPARAQKRRAVGMRSGCIPASTTACGGLRGQPRALSTRSFQAAPPSAVGRWGFSRHEPCRSISLLDPSRSTPTPAILRLPPTPPRFHRIGVCLVLYSVVMFCKALHGVRRCSSSAGATKRYVPEPTSITTWPLSSRSRRRLGISASGRSLSVTSAARDAGTVTVADVFGGTVISHSNRSSSICQWLAIRPWTEFVVGPDPGQVAHDLRSEDELLESRRSRIGEDARQAAIEPLFDVAQHAVVLRGGRVGVPGLGQASWRLCLSW